MAKHQSRYLTQMQFNKLVAERLSQLHEQIKKFKKLEAQGLSLQTCLGQAARRSDYMRVLVKRVA
jgi:hypothetical protein